MGRAIGYSGASHFGLQSVALSYTFPRLVTGKRVEPVQSSNEVCPAAGEALAISIPVSKAAVMALSGVHTPWALRAGCSVRNNFTSPVCLPKWSPLNPTHKGSRDPARGQPPLPPHTRAGFSLASETPRRIAAPRKVVRFELFSSPA